MIHSVKYRASPCKTIHRFIFTVNDANNEFYTKISIIEPYCYPKNEWLDFIDKKLDNALIFKSSKKFTSLEFIDIDCIELSVMISSNKNNNTNSTIITTSFPVSKIKNDLLSAIEEADKNGMWV